MDRRTQEISLSLKQVQFVNIFEKPGTLIFLMKEHAKLYRSRKSQQSQNVSKILLEKRPNPDKINIDAGSGSKRRKVIEQEQIEEAKVPMRNPFFQDKLY